MSNVLTTAAVYDSNGNELFPNAKQMRAAVNPPARAMKHPLETGASTVDNIVYDPVEITLSVVIDPSDYPNTYANDIWNTFKAAGTVTIQTKTRTFGDMLMIGPPYDEVPEIFDTVAVSLKFTEAVFVAAQYAQLPKSSVKKASNASTTQTGQKTPAAATPTAAQSIFGFFGGKT